MSIAVDGSGNLIVAEYGNHCVHKITLNGRASGHVTTGSGTPGWADGRRREAQFYNPKGVVVDDSDNIIVADQSNHRIRKISPEGNVSTLAGNGTRGWRDGQGTQAQFCYPGGGGRWQR
uniref:SMP-30/Gluconolactonase/LRE-like region domain-containing protein n=1 Tax=Chromera velia CCMP2878 TaxID=1169474 RepID=A0A0G4GW57_9ALVE|eukprot:Cvel_23651.t1-p1 / transcript=Cvel_23651.t1 / gene=Cvel_23651 / organism=Chromera_velia_CCMP2878 / gene_product=NHL repeat-containing protein 2, putative / transcript_product=NHL repeat-containing protein 2, putative / location=Cvel_scaffold2462:4426-4779(-) / protein_length=118 / sequence_SO=supercontig / SO=protein_coding / is_pseudo=false